MYCDKLNSKSRSYDFKYASNDCLNTKKRYSHVQSKVKLHIENMRKEDQERRRIKITRHRSEPSELAHWNASDMNESNTHLKLVVEEMECKLNEMKTYGDTMNDLLNIERSRRLELQKKLDAIQLRTKIVNSCTWSDPGLRIGDCVADSNKSGYEGTILDDDGIEDSVFNNSTEWLGKVGSEEHVDDDENDKTILLTPVEQKPVKKGMKYRVKKLLRCCAPCIKPKVV